MFLQHTYQNLEQWLNIHPEYGIAAAFVVAFIESLAVIGSLVPGSVTMTIVGTMIGSSLLPLYPAFLAAFSGSLLGDILSYYVGFYYQDQVRTWKPMHKYQPWISQGEKFINKYGMMSVIIGRFFGPMRSMIPMIAGLLKMRPLTFVVAAIPSATLWVIVYLTPGMVLGIFSLELPSKIAMHAIINSLLGLSVIIVLLYLIKKYRCCLMHLGHCFLQKQAKFISQHVMKTKKNSIKQVQYGLILGYMATICFILFLGLGHIVSQTQHATSINHVVYYCLQNLHTSWLNNLTLFTTFMADKYVVSIAILALTAMFFLNLCWQEAIALLVTTAISVMVIKVLKMHYFIARPPRMFHILGHTSFPSGHVSYITFITSYLYIRLRSHWQARPTNWPWLLTLIIPCYVLFTRVYLGAHWLTDVVAGMVLGLALACALNLFLLGLAPTKPKTLTNTVRVTLAVWLVSTYFFAQLHFSSYGKNFFHYRQHALQQQSWLSNPRKLASFRRNRFGSPQEVFNIQWAENLTAITKQLQHAGWQIQKLPNSWWQRLMFTLDHPNLRFMPKLPKLHLTEPAVLFAYQLYGDNIKVLRLWRSNYELLEHHTPIYLGTLYQTQKQGEKLHRHYSPRQYQITIDPKSLSYFRKVNRRLHTISWLPLKKIHWPISQKQQINQFYSI